METACYQPEIERAERSFIKELQTKRLRAMLENAYKNVPFYTAKLDEAGINPEKITIDDIASLPFTYKQDLRDNYPYGLFAVGRDKIARIHASSGTTGKQTVVGYTLEDIDIWAQCCARAIAGAGGGVQDYIHVAYGYGLFTGGLGLHYGAEKLGAAAIPVSAGNTARQIQILQDFGSDILCCTPSYAMLLGETLRDMKIDPKSLRLRAGIFGAEPWSENMRRQIEDILAIKAYDIYGLSEISGPGVSFECAEQNGMHVNEDCFYPEIIDPDTGEILRDGEFGELVFTCITKTAMPLIRYRTRDLCSLTREPCSCGRTLIKMSRPRGRTDDMLIIRGVNVFPSQVEHVLLEMGVEPNYLIVIDRVNNLDTFEIKVEMADTLFTDTVRGIEDFEKRIEGALASSLNVGAKVRMVEAKSLPRSEGKAKRVIDNRKI